MTQTTSGRVMWRVNASKAPLWPSSHILEVARARPWHFPQKVTWFLDAIRFKLRQPQVRCTHCFRPEIQVFYKRRYVYFSTYMSYLWIKKYCFRVQLIIPISFFSLALEFRSDELDWSDCFGFRFQRSAENCPRMLKLLGIIWKAVSTTSHSRVRNLPFPCNAVFGALNDGFHMVGIRAAIQT